MSSDLNRTIVHMNSAERDRSQFASPNNYRTQIIPSICDVREIRLLQASIPRTDLRVADGILQLYVDRVLKQDVVEAFVVGSLVVYSLSSSDSIWKQYSYFHIDSPLVVHTIDDAVLSGEIRGYVSRAGDSVVFTYARADAIYAKVFSPLSSQNTAVASTTTLATSTGAQPNIASSLAPGRSYFVHGSSNGGTTLGIVRTHAPATSLTFVIAADRSLAIGLGVNVVANLRNDKLKWRLRVLGTRTVGVILKESIAAYVYLDSSQTYVVSTKPVATYTTVLGNIPNLQLVFDIVTDLGPSSVQTVIAEAARRNYVLLDTTLNALPSAATENGLISASTMLYLINQTEFEIAAAEYNAILFAQAVADGYYLPVGGYGNARYKLVNDDVYISDTPYGGSSKARVLDACRRELLIGEQSWIKVVDNISLWQSDVALVASRRLVRFLADDTSARFVTKSSDLATTAPPEHIALLLRTNVGTRKWESKLQSNLPHFSAWPPRCAVSSSDNRSLVAFLYSDGKAWIESLGVLFDIAPGSGNNALAAASAVPGARFLAASTDDGIYGLAEATGQLYMLSIDVSNLRVNIVEYAPSLSTSIPLPTSPSLAASGRVLLNGTRAFFFGTSSAVFVYVPNYIMIIRGNTSTIANYYTQRGPIAVAVQNALEAVFVDAIGTTLLQLTNFNAYIRIGVDHGDTLDTNIIPFVSWSNPAAFVTENGDFYTYYDSTPDMMMNERTYGDKPVLAVNTVSAWWREGDSLFLATSAGQYSVTLTAPVTNRSQRTLALVNLENGKTVTVLDANVVAGSTIEEARDGGLTLKTPAGDWYLYNTTNVTPAALMAESSSLGAYDGFVVLAGNAWLRGNLSVVETRITSSVQPVRIVQTPVTIVNATLRSACYSRILDEFAPEGLANAILAVGSTGQRTKVAVFSADTPSTLYATSNVTLIEVLPGGFLAAEIVAEQVAISYRTLSGGIKTVLAPVPYTQKALSVQLVVNSSGNSSLVTWSSFNQNTYNEATLVYERDGSVYFPGDLTYEQSGSLSLSSENLIAGSFDGNITFLRAEPIYVSPSANVVAAFATIVATSNSQLYVSHNTRDYDGWYVGETKELVASNVKVLDTTVRDGNTIYISVLDKDDGTLGVVSIGGYDVLTGFSSIQRYARRTPTSDELPFALRTATPISLKPFTASVMDVSTTNVAKIVFTDSVGLRVAQRRLETFAGVPYYIKLQALEGTVPSTLTNLTFTIDPNFSVSQGSLVDDSRGLAISHSLVPFAIDFRNDVVLAAVLGWRDNSSLIISSVSVNAQMSNKTIDIGALQTIFALADKNNDGELTVPELLSIATLPLTQLAASMDSTLITDVDNLLASLSETSTFNAVALAGIRALDPNQSGTVSTTEFADFVSNFAAKAHSMRSPGDIDEGGTQIVELHLLVDGHDALSTLSDGSKSRPFALMFLNVSRGSRTLYTAGGHPSMITFNPSRNVVNSLQVSFWNPRLDAAYDFKMLENQLVFEFRHGSRYVASERMRRPDGTYDPRIEIVPTDMDALRGIVRNPVAYSDSEEASIMASSSASDESDSDESL